MMMLEEGEGIVGSNSASSTPVSGVYFSPNCISHGVYVSPNCISHGGEISNTPPQPQRNRQLFVPEEDKGTCFYCQKQGHWIKDCPMKKSPKTPQPSSPSSPIIHGVPNLICPCGAGTCFVRISRTQRNPDRMFYCCPFPHIKNCKFFEWCDKVWSDKIIVPICRCDAGRCSIYKETTMPNAGRYFFVCPIKKGQGACDFIQSLDAANSHSDRSIISQSTLTNCHDTSPSSSDLFVEEGDFSHQGMDVESPVVDTPEHPRKLGAISEMSKKDKVTLMDFRAQEDTSDELMRKHCKRQRHGAPEVDGFILDSTSYCSDMPQSKSGDLITAKALRASTITSEVLIHQRQAKFLRQISYAGASLSEGSTYYPNVSALPTTMVPMTENCLERTAIYQILGFNVNGWCGRLVFSPSRCLIFPAPKPFFCCVFPSFDPIFVPRDVDIFDAEEASNIAMHSLSSAESTQRSLLTPGQPLGAALPSEPSGLNPPPKILQGNIMTSSIVEEFKQVAVRLQDGLFSVLKSMDFHDHESMILEAYSVFGALDALFVYYQPFKEQVEKFIGCAASLAEVELAIHNDHSSQELVNMYERKKLQLEDISHLHADTWAALEVSNEHLQFLQKEASRVKDMLLCIEEELSCCEAEKMEIESRLDQITEGMLDSEVSLQVAFSEAEAAMKLCQQREAQRKVAKEAFEKAKSNLRRNL